MNRLINLCYKLRNISDYKWHKPEAFVFRSVNNFTQIDAINGNHTTMFKIRFKNHDLGVWFEHPMIYQGTDADKKKWNLERLNLNLNYEQNYLKSFDTFHDIFNTQFDISKYKPIKQIIYSGLDSVRIINNNIGNVYSIDLIASVFLDGLNEFNLKITGKETPLRLNYQYGIFDIYCLIAPLITDKYDIFLRV